MRQPILTNNHRRAPLPPPNSNNLIPRPLRHPMVIPTKVKEQPSNRFTSLSNTPNIITPFVGGNSPHFISCHVSVPLISPIQRHKKSHIQSLPHTTSTFQKRTRSVQRVGWGITHHDPDYGS